MNRKFPPGVATGDLLDRIIIDAKKNGYAIPACNVIGSNSINAVMEAAAEINSPIIIQLTYGGSHFNAGVSLSKSYIASIQGAIAAAKHIHTLSKLYGATVILHTDHCNRNNLKWLDGIMYENQKYYDINGKTLFSSHMIDLSNESLYNNIETCKRYLEKMSKLNLTLEIELGAIGGEEDGVDNSYKDNDIFYTNPNDILYAYKSLTSISKKLLIAASFGNVHGVYKKGNILLDPEILNKSQVLVSNVMNLSKNPINFVFHGGSGSSVEDIRKAINYGVVKLNLDTDLQFHFMKGVREYFIDKNSYLDSQIGNPLGENDPNKIYYDPRIWLRQGEIYFKNKIIQYCEYLNNINRLS